MVIDMFNLHFKQIMKQTAGITLTMFSVFTLLTVDVHAAESRGITIEKTAQ